MPFASHQGSNLSSVPASLRMFAKALLIGMFDSLGSGGKLCGTTKVNNGHVHLTHLSRNATRTLLSHLIVTLDVLNGIVKMTTGGEPRVPNHTTNTSPITAPISTCAPCQPQHHQNPIDDTGPALSLPRTSSSNNGLCNETA